MQTIPADIWEQFSAVLKKRAVPISCLADSRKWLQYYLDFCHKYCHRYADRESLKHFMLKLHEKHQSLAMQEEAAKAATLYYEMHLN